MVFSGVPSKACEYYRVRKIKCDQASPGCSQCFRMKILCPGYPNPLDSVFRSEDEAVARKSQLMEAMKKKRRNKPSLRRRGDSVPATMMVFGSSPAELVIGEGETISGEQSQHRRLQIHAPFPPLDDLATCFLFHHFVMNDIDPAKAHMGHLPSMVQDAGNDALSTAAIAVGLGCLSNFRQWPSGMVRARQKRTWAVRLINIALQNPDQRSRDEVLMTVILLGVFETIMGSARQGIESREVYLKGAIALLKLRGPDQFKTRVGISMYFQLRSQVLTSSIQRGVYNHDSGFGWASKIVKLLSPDELLVRRLMDITTEFAKTRGSLRDRSLTDPETIILTLLNIDTNLAVWGASLPPGWSYAIRRCPPHPGFYDGLYHAYLNFEMATTWNSYRTIRILVNETFLSHVGLERPQSRSTDLTARCQHAHHTITQMCSDFCASVPYYLGRTALGSDKHTVPTVGARALGGYLIMWRLFLFGSIVGKPDRQRLWFVKQLQSIGSDMVIRVATSLADDLLGNGSIAEALFNRGN